MREIKVGEPHWAILREQKLALQACLRNVNEEKQDLIEGVISYLDHIQDVAVQQKVATELEVFGFSVDTLINQALDAACDTVQKALGVTTGDYAAIHFTGADYEDFAQAMRKYIVSEMKIKGIVS